MILLAKAKQIVRALTDTELLPKGQDQGAERARRPDHCGGKPSCKRRRMSQYAPRYPRRSASTSTSLPL